MFCKNCGVALGDDDKFCAACGTPVATTEASGKRNPTSRSHNNRPGAEFQRSDRNGPRRPPFIQNPAAINQLNGFLAKKAKLKRMITWPIAAVCALYAGFCLYVGETSGALLGLVFALVAFFSAFTQSHLSRTEYNLLPGSSTDNGKPRCVHCGHVGLYTHGKYKSETKFHDCSKCGATLYTS